MSDDLEEDRRLELRDALDKLPEDERTVITLVILEGKSIRYICNLMGESPLTIRRLYAKASTKLRLALKKQNLISYYVDASTILEDKDVDIVIEWDPELVSQDQYARLVTAIGDLVRAEGGEGIQRVRAQGVGIGIPCDVGVPQ